MGGRRAQRGAALIVLTAIVVVSIVAFLVTSLNAALNQTAASRNRNADVLHQAKTALIGYVVKEALDLGNAVPGRLPCPESPGDAGTNLEGRAASSCTPGFPTNKNVGRLPWRTLGSDKLVDAAGEPLWYAVSPNWVLGSTPPVINSGSSGQLSVDGSTDVVAVIIAPGTSVSLNPNTIQTADGCVARVQLRDDRSHVPSSSANPDYRDYLECENATYPTPDAVFKTSIAENALNPVLNDQLVFITARDILNAIQGPVTERMQRTVAPLLNEYSDRWTSTGGTFMPYARQFTPPEVALAAADHCGDAAITQASEGLLPVAGNSLSGNCSSTWTSPSISGPSITTTPCTVDTTVTGRVTCSFTYYRLTPLAQLVALVVAGLSPPGTTANATIQAVAPRAAASFRDPLQAADVVVSPPTAASVTPTMTPMTNGSAQVTIQVNIATSYVCADYVALSLLCSTINSIPLVTALVGGLVVSPQNVTVTIPPLADPILQGTRLSAQALAASTAPYDLLNPNPDDVHYWFMENEWYRYTYYAVSPGASAAATGGSLAVSGFPTEFGNSNDKRFVLALMGPAVTGQSRGTAAALDQYIEGINAVSTASPRFFAYQVFTASGNDRIAACPFAAGGTQVCN